MGFSLSSSWSVFVVLLNLPLPLAFETFLKRPDDVLEVVEDSTSDARSSLDNVLVVKFSPQFFSLPY